MSHARAFAGGEHDLLRRNPASRSSRNPKCSINGVVLMLLFVQLLVVPVCGQAQDVLNWWTTTEPVGPNGTVVTHNDVDKSAGALVQLIRVADTNITFPVYSSNGLSGADTLVDWTGCGYGAYDATFSASDTFARYGLVATDYIFVRIWDRPTSIGGNIPDPQFYSGQGQGAYYYQSAVTRISELPNIGGFYDYIVPSIQLDDWLFLSTTGVVLSITSTYGTAIPSVGSHTYGTGSVLTNVVSSPDTRGTTQYVCSGWTGTGDAPPSGSTNRVVFSISTNSTLVWNWQAQYMLSLQSTGGLISGATSGFKAENMVATLSPAANSGYYFDHWVVNGANAGTFIPLVVTMTGSKAVQAVFNAILSSRNDYNADNQAELAIFDPNAGKWYIRMANSGAVLAFGTQWGFKGCTPVPGDYDGDSASDLALYENATANWYIWSLAKTGMIAFARNWGFAGCVPVSGDFNGDRADDLAVYHPASGKWYIQVVSNGAVIAMGSQWGFSGCVPVPGDYDGDRKADLAVYDTAHGDWYILPSQGGPFLKRNWGFAGCRPVPGDYDGDGKTDLAVYNGATGKWYILYSGTPSSLVLGWGFAGCVPVPADYDRDGAFDAAVYDQNNGKWYIWSIKKNSLIGSGINWGFVGALPVGGYR